MRNRWIYVGLILVASLVATTATAQVVSPAESNAPRSADEAVPAAEEVDAKAIWRQQLDCTLFRPSEVQGYYVQCGAPATFLDARHADGFIPGDHFQSKLKSWDNAPNTAVTTSPGPANVFGVPARVYNYGGTPWNAGLTAYLECTYLHGVNVFPAGSFIDLSSDGNCTVTADAPRSRIDRSP
jgi:hypothetical protein